MTETRETEERIRFSISVPQVLAANGYTPEVAAERLQNALNDIVNHAHSRRGGPDVAMQTDLPSIVVPSTALSTESLAAQIRRFFRINNRRNVSGEITIVEKKVWLRLRMNGRDLYASATGVDPEHPDDLFAPAAQMVLDETDPYIFAASLSKTNPGKSLEIAKRIISERPVNDPIISWAHNFIGFILRDQHKTEEAIAEIRKALELDPGLVAAHTTMGLALGGQGKTDEAIAEYQKAIELDPRDAYYLMVRMSRFTSRAWSSSQACFSPGDIESHWVAGTRAGIGVTFRIVAMPKAANWADRAPKAS